jgi:hypothetical protein
MSERPQLDELEDPMGDDPYRSLMDESGVIHFTDPEHQNTALGEWFRYSRLPGSRVRSLIGGQKATVTGYDDEREKYLAVADDGTQLELDMDEIGFPHAYVVDHDYSLDIEVEREVDQRTHAQQTPGSGEHWSDEWPGRHPGF